VREQPPPPHGVNEDTPCKVWYVLGNGVVINRLLHLTEKLGSQFHCGGYHLGLEFVVTDFDFVGVDQILREQCEMHKKLVDFSH
jgi:hypothetical protein